MIEMTIALLTMAMIGVGNQVYQEAADRSLEREYKRYMGCNGTCSNKSQRIDRYCNDSDWVGSFDRGYK